MNKICFFLTTILALLFLASCDNDDHATDSRSPEFGALTLEPSTVLPGDSVTATVSYKYAGKKIYSSEYILTVTGVTSEGQYVNSVKWKVVDPTKSAPTQRFAAPDVPGNYTVTFRASQINYSSGGPNGELYGSANSVSTTLRVREN